VFPFTRIALRLIEGNFLPQTRRAGLVDTKVAHEDTAADTKVLATPSSNCAANFVLAQWWQLHIAGRFV